MNTIQFYLLPLVFFCSTALGGTWYLGVGIGKTESDYSPVSTDSVAGWDSVYLNWDTTDTGSKLYGGYRFLDYVSIEAGYLDMGDIVTTDDHYIDARYTLNSNVTVSADGYYVSALGRLPISDRVVLNGTIGTYWWDVTGNGRTSGTGLLSGPARTVSNSESGADFFAGLGLEVWLFTVEYERYRFDPDGDDGEVDVDYIGISGRFEF